MRYPYQWKTSEEIGLIGKISIPLPLNDYGTGSWAINVDWVPDQQPFQRRDAAMLNIATSAIVLYQARGAYDAAYAIHDFRCFNLDW